MGLFCVCFARRSEASSVASHFARESCSIGCRGQWALAGFGTNSPDASRSAGGFPFRTFLAIVGSTHDSMMIFSTLRKP